ncbi:MAG TPA: hypothetical protein VGR27_00975 [Longimicrobiaceae bacterium]|nr:hypothetical protein [Longimicrobiaceae bacterium]
MQLLRGEVMMMTLRQFLSMAAADEIEAAGYATVDDLWWHARTNYADELVALGVELDWEEARHGRCFVWRAARALLDEVERVGWDLTRHYRLLRRDRNGRFTAA